VLVENGFERSCAGSVLVMSERAGEWLTIKEAARLLGVHYSAVPKMVRRGDLTPRANQRPSLSRQAVLGLREARAERARLRALPPAPKELPQPPDDGHDWVDAATVAAHLGVGIAAVHQRARRGRLPFALGSDSRTRFYRLDLVDMAVRAQEATRAKSLTRASARVEG
jgi:DNA-directed RNA polymerase specialized sigma24 family protein